MNSKLNYIVAFVVLFLMSSNMLVAQDMIHLKKKGEVVEAKVIEIGTGEIKYKLWTEKEDGLVYVVEKTAVSHIIFQSGRTEYFGQETMDMEAYFEGQKKRAGKISFLGPMTGYTTLSYEQNLKPGRSFEVKAAFIGLGLNNDNRNASGFIGSVGYRLYKKPSFVTADLRRRHLLQGGYVKAELFAGHSSFDRYFFSGDERVSSTTFGFLLNLGKQWVLGEAFVIDLSGGIGFGDGETVKAYYMSQDGNVVGTFSLDIGFLF